jgi:hypothetical protein
VKLKGIELGSRRALVNVYFDWGRCQAGCDPTTLFRAPSAPYDLDESELLMLLTPLAGGDTINLQSFLVEPQIKRVYWEVPSVELATENPETVLLKVEAVIPTHPEARPLTTTVRVRRNLAVPGTAGVEAPSEVVSTPWELLPGVPHTFDVPVVVDLQSESTQGNLGYTATYSLDFNAGKHFLACNNIDPAWTLPPSDPTILVVRAPLGRAHIETTTFSPATVSAGQPSNLIVTVHHGVRMGEKQIPVQIAPQSGSNPCIMTSQTERNAQVPKGRKSAGTVSVTFPFTTTGCQGTIQVTYRALIPTGRGIEVELPMDDTDLLTVNLPSQPKLEITSPGRDTTLYFQHGADGFPSMPLLENTSVRITGVNPDPTSTTTFRWKIRVLYQTRTTTARQTEVFWEQEAQGSSLPTDTVRRQCGTIVGEFAGSGSHLSCVAGGEVLFEVRATVNGQELMASREGPKILAGNNPSQGNVQTRIDSLSDGDMEKATWLKRIACRESGGICRSAPGQRQFVMPEHTSDSCCTTFRQCKGEPVWNSGGDGGVGIMQITLTNRLPRPSPAEIWDWRCNVDEGVRVFDIDKRPEAEAYPSAVQNGRDFRDMVTRTNQWRRSQRMQEVRIIVPDYSTAQFRLYQVREPALNGQRVQRDMLVEDTIRGFNGFPIPDNNPGQFGLRWHEFWLWTRRVDIPNVGNNLEILEVENEGPDPTNPTKRIAYAIWERIPAASRPAVGDPNYVNHIRCADPLCMGATNPDPLCRR